MPSTRFEMRLRDKRGRFKKRVGAPVRPSIVWTAKSQLLEAWDLPQYGSRFRDAEPMPIARVFLDNESKSYNFGQPPVTIEQDSDFNFSIEFGAWDREVFIVLTKDIEMTVSVETGETFNAASQPVNLMGRWFGQSRSPGDDVPAGASLHEVNGSTSMAMTLSSYEHPELKPLIMIGQDQQVVTPFWDSQGNKVGDRVLYIWPRLFTGVDIDSSAQYHFRSDSKGAHLSWYDRPQWSSMIFLEGGRFTYNSTTPFVFRCSCEGLVFPLSVQNTASYWKAIRGIQDGYRPLSRFTPTRVVEEEQRWR